MVHLHRRLGGPPAFILMSILFSAGCGDAIPVQSVSPLSLRPNPHGEESELELPLDSDFRGGVEGIFFSSRMPREQAETLAKDILFLKQADIKADPEFTSIMGSKVTSGATLLGWLQERVQYILEETELLRKRMNDGLELLALNLGAEKYIRALNAKKPHPVLTIPGVGGVVISSPRVGVIQISNRFFDSSTDIRNIPVSRAIYRLSVLFHEGRHSDGRGASLGFSHGTCPAKHEYAGLNVCDLNSNGPYQVESRVLGALIQGCTSCSPFGREVIRAVQADALARVISGSPEWDSTPVSGRP